MHASFSYSLALLVGFAASAFANNLTMLKVPRSHDDGSSNYNCLNFPEKMLVCHACFGPGLTDSIVACCQDFKTAAACMACLKDPSNCSTPSYVSTVSSLEHLQRNSAYGSVSSLEHPQRISAYGSVSSLEHPQRNSVYGPISSLEHPQRNSAYGRVSSLEHQQQNSASSDVSSLEHPQRNSVASAHYNGYIHESDRLEDTIDRPTCFNCGGYYVSRKKASEEQRRQKRQDMHKKWYSPYKYILSLFPQRLSYGHSVFLQGMMAQRRKSNNLETAPIAWMKKSGRSNGHFGQFYLDFDNDLKQAEMPRSTKDAGDSAVGENTKVLAQLHLRPGSTNYAPLLHDADKAVGQGVISELPVGTYNVDLDYQAPIAHAEGTRGSMNTKREPVSDSDLVRLNGGSVVDYPWTELLAQAAKQRLQSADNGDKSRPDYFYTKLLLFVDTLKQAARDHFQGQ